LNNLFLFGSVALFSFFCGLGGGGGSLSSMVKEAVYEVGGWMIRANKTNRQSVALLMMMF
jgi:hypothetical protein